MVFETLKLTEEDEVATITLSNGSGNFINTKMISDLTSVCDHLEDHSDAKTVIITGSNGCFSEGVDFRDFHPDKPMDIHGFNKWEKICRRLENLPMSTIAMIDGPAIGGGFQMALVCDLRICTENTTLQLPEAHLGFIPGMASFRLAKYVGLGHAKRIIITCAKIGHTEAKELGLIDHIADSSASGIAWALDSLGPNHSVAVTLTRRLLNESFTDAWEDAVGHFLAAQHRSISQTAFLETIRKETGDAS